MKKQTFLILALFTFLFGKVNALPVPGNKATTDTATTFVLSNEEGGLIDQLIAAGYGNNNLYATLAALQEASGGVISNKFLEVLGACPAGSPIFTQVLNNYANISGGVAINTDGTVFITNIKGRNYFGQPGYSTYPPNQFGEGRELFTYANSPEYYIDVPNGGTTYKVFAIGWSSSNEVPTFMLSNEEGGLIDKLIADGHGDESLYEVLQILQPISGGAIPADYMAALAATPADCEAKTTELSNSSDSVNNPIGIGMDGTLIVAPIYGRDYYEHTGFSTTTGNIAGVGTVLFTSSDSEDDFIDAGTLVDNFGVTYYYKVFAIGWMSDLISVNDLTKNENIIVYPNPTTGMVWFDMQNPETIIKVAVYDMKGEELFCTDNLMENHIDLSGLENGMYLLELETHSQKLKQKVIKK